MVYFSKAPLSVISPDDGYDYFFGYYDLQPFDASGERHLAARAAFHDRLPEASDVLELGYLTIRDRCFHKVAESHAWNFQQGSLLQWYDEERIIYNDFRDGRFVSVIKHIETGEERVLVAPLANLSLDRKWGLSINFSRVYDFRPGYGYCNLPDRFADEPAPREDGIFLVDLEQNTSRLIVSYQTIKETFAEPPYTDMKILINHITFNPSADRFLFLARNFPKPGERWGTLLATASRDGGGLFALSSFGAVNSHYHWKNDREIMIYAGYPEWGIYFLEDEKPGFSRLYDERINRGDIHCLYHPDRSCFIGDGYPRRGDDSRTIHLYDFETKTSHDLVKVYSEPVEVVDNRCDLHNRFNRDGTAVSFDSFHDGIRRICLFPFDKKELMK